MTTSYPAISVRIPGILFVSGGPVEGELELNYRALQDDNIQEVHVKLRGFAKTEIRRGNNSTNRKRVQLVRVDASLWTRGSAYPPPGSDIIRIPFCLQLPAGLPPSFQYNSRQKKGSVMYSFTAVGVRPGAFQFNRRIRQPLAVVQKDDVGMSVREQLTALASAGAEQSWKIQTREEKIRRGLWGDYATVNVLWSMPNVSPLPLFVPIPFIIKIRTTTAPHTRAKADAHPPDKPIFPAPPSAYSMLDFKLRQKVYLRARGFTERPSTDVNVFTPGPGFTVDTDIAENEWLWAEGEDIGAKTPEAKGIWKQRTTFRGTLTLACPPTFSLEKTIGCEYFLSLKVPFPGLGNDVKMNMPIIISSGLNAPVMKDQPRSESSAAPAAPNVLDLPPSYWDANNGEWDDHKD
ncbi:hypothetical protein OH77DRAFT_1425041 [Trametes cingulata]|nr:hypothetical protein OH77DRAFT_1425041 [Trametes cingulata]